MVPGRQSKDRPDLAIEIIWTSGGIEKLEIYRRLSVGEVWFWIEGRIDVHVLRDGHYSQQELSACLPGLDLALVGSLVERPTVLEAMRALRDTLK